MECHQHVALHFRFQCQIRTCRYLIFVSHIQFTLLKRKITGLVNGTPSQEKGQCSFRDGYNLH